MIKAIWNVLLIGGWAPLLLLIIHVYLSRVLNAYALWPPIDIPMHFIGGLAITFLTSRCFRALPRKTGPSSRLAALELILIVNLTSTAAVFWEFQEFTRDQIFGSNIQVSLANTMQDMAMGILGALVFASTRLRQLRVGIHEFSEIAGDWARGYTS
jgi:hypothetical protein